MIEDIGPPLFVAVNNHFGIAISPKTVAAALQFNSQFLVIIDLAVENDANASFGIEHRLMTSGQIDNGKPPKSQSDWPGDKVTLIVRSSVSDSIGHTPNRCWLDRLVARKIKLTANAAHFIKQTSVIVSQRSEPSRVICFFVKSFTDLIRIVLRSLASTI